MSRDVSRRSVLQSAGVASGSVLFVGEAFASKGKNRPEFVIGTGSQAAARAATSRAESVSRVLDFEGIGQAVSGRFPPEAIEALRKRADVRYVEPDGAVPPLGQTLPWGIDRVDADEAHSAGETGNGADIAILDSGIDSTHEDLEANLGEGYAVVSCSDSGCDEAWDDDHGHGTHCAGIAAAIDNDVGVVGVSTAATLHAVKVFNSDEYATVSGLSEGIKWVADRGYDVGSISLGATSSYSTLRDACEYAEERGVFLVAAAGNDGDCSDCVRYPAAYSTVVAVSATTSSDGLASFSSAGPEVELAAPGRYVYATVPGDNYTSKSGTSMACPHVSGAGGQLMANGYSNEEARQRLRETAEDIGLSDEEQGYGLLDVKAAVDDSGDDDGGDVETTLSVSTDRATDVGETSATLDGSLDGLEGVSSAEVYFEWGEAGDGFPEATPPETRSSTGQFDADLTDLASGTDYEFRAVAEADGERDTGETLTVTTETVDVSLEVSTIGSSEIDETSATLDGSLDELGGVTSADIYFEYREIESDHWTATSGETVSATGAFSDTVTDLTEETEYEFRAVAEADDAVVTGERLRFTTETVDVSLEVSTTGSSETDGTSATLDGSLDGLEGVSSAEVYFEWGESGDGLPETTPPETRSSTGQFDADLTDLANGTDYEFRAVAEADGGSDMGETLTLTTDTEADPSDPEIDSYSVSERGSPNPHAEITAEWVVSDAAGDLDSVLVEVIDSRGSVEASNRTAVSGERASGTDELRVKHARNERFDVRLLVADSHGNTASRTETVST